jgi:hypothetical protein
LPRKPGAAGASQPFGVVVVLRARDNHRAAVAPLFVLPLVGLAGPLFAFALIGLAVVISIGLWLPNDRGGRRVGHGAAMTIRR